MLQPPPEPGPGRPPPAGDDFLRDLRHFHEARGTPFKRSPTLGGRPIDLRLLYELVTADGGWVKVNSKNSWSSLLHHFQLPNNTVNGAIALKQIYLRYLDRWEKIHLGGDEADRAEDDDYDDDSSRHKRPGAAASARHLHATPHHYNHQQHQVTAAQREFHLLSNDVYPNEGWEYERLSLSLSSPLPNEQDFALNACTLLSNDGRPGRTLRLDRYPRILDHLLAHAHVYNHGSLRQLFTHYYRDIRRRPARTFWKDAVESREFLFLSREGRFCGGELVDTVDLDEEFEDEVESDAEEQQPLPKFTRCPEDDELFCLKRTLGTQDYIGQRVLQVATILRNLCYVEENVPVLAKNKTFVRFLLLCSTSKWNNLKSLGLDMLGNISSEYIVKDLQSDVLTETLLKIIVKNLCSDDRACCISSLEALNKLSQNEKNEDVLLRTLEADVYKRVCSFLTIHDVMLLIYTLECLYALSSLGERACSLITNSRHGVVDTLVALVTVEGKSYGPRACIGMKLVETVPSGGQQAPATAAPVTVTTAPATVVVAQQPSQQQQAKTATQLVATPVRAAVPIAPQRLAGVAAAAAATPPPAAVTLVPAATPPPPLPTPTPPPAPSPSPATPQPQQQPSATAAQLLTPQQAIAQAHAQQQAVHEDERFALAWLRATYEPAPAGAPCPRLDHRELYRHYMASCGQLGRRGVISPLHFPRCVRSVFGGTVGPNPMRPGAGEPQYYDGIRQRATPLLLPACKTTQQSGAPNQQQQPLQLQQQQAGSAMTGSTSLIKSLLATKVNEEQPQTQGMRAAAAPVATVAAAQVAARQQRLQMGKSAESKDCARLNGVRQLFPAEEDSRPPPLAPLSEDLPNGLGDDEQKPPLRLADLLERKCERSVPAALMNGAHELVEDRIEKALSEDRPLETMEIKIELKEELLEAEVIEKPGAKRPAVDDIAEVEGKKPKLAALNGTAHASEDSSSCGGGNEEVGGPSSGVSNAAAKLFADMAADILEDEDEEQLIQTTTTTTTTPTIPEPAPSPARAPTPAPSPAPAAAAAAPLQQFVVDGSTGQVVQVSAAAATAAAAGRHIVVSKAAAAVPQAVVVQAARPAAGAPLVIQSGAGGAPLLLQTAGGQVQIVQGAAPAQYVLHGHHQAQHHHQGVVVQQAAAAPKTIIILQQQGQQPQQHQKVMVTPQGQQVVVTQVARPASAQIAPARQAKSPVAVAANGEAQQQQQQKVEEARPVRDLTTPFVCEWGRCAVETKFKSANEVYMHVCAAHCPAGSEEVTCQWDRCDNMKRKRFSLMTHLHDKHCNPEAMRQSLSRRKQQAAGGAKAEAPAPAPAATPHPGYAPDAALHAIKRHALEFVNPKELQDDNEGPVTKSIRLTAALILRNLAIYNGQSRRYLKAYESHLANVALSNVESSRTVAQILYDMSDAPGPR